MDPAYEAYFNERLDRISAKAAAGGVGALREGLAAEDPAHYVARGAVERAQALAQQEHSTRLRPDAALLLYLLSYEFAGAPVRRVHPEQSEELAGALSDDVTHVVGAAAERVQDRSDGISAHALLDAVSGSWDALQTTAFTVWG
jgi:hypothetical protein